MMDPCVGWSITSIGMNWEQKGRTFSSAPTALYWSTTSGMAFPFSLQRGNLNTGTPSFSASVAVESLKIYFNLHNFCVLFKIQMQKKEQWWSTPAMKKLSANNMQFYISKTEVGQSSIVQLIHNSLCFWGIPQQEN